MVRRVLYILFLIILTSCTFEARMEKIDKLPPTSPLSKSLMSLNYKTHNDLFSSPEIEWTPSSDGNGRGIDHYEISLGTLENIESVKQWSNVGLATKASFSGLNLQRGTKYIFGLRAVDKAGNISDPVFSDYWYAEPKIVDLAPASLGRKFNSTVLNRFLDNNKNEYLVGSFTRYNFHNLSCMAKINLDGSLNSNWAQYNILGCGSGNIYQTTLQTVNTSQYILVYGTNVVLDNQTMPSLFRVNLSDGKIDQNFIANIGSGPVGTVNSIVVQTDGKIILGGNISSFNGSTVGNIVRLNSDGTIDNSISFGSGFDKAINSIALFSDGRIVVGGYFTKYNNVSISKLITVLDPNGQINASFAAGIGTGIQDGGGSYYVSFVNVTSGGQILASGRFTSINSYFESSVCTALINADGTIDANFNTKIAKNFFSISVSQILELPDNSYLFTGPIYQYGGQNYNGILKVFANGSVDTTFKTNTNTDVIDSGTFAFVDGTRILLTGSFNSMNGNSNYKTTVALNLDGSVDNTFNNANTATFSSAPRSIIKSSSAYFLFGGMKHIGGDSVSGMIKYKTDGNVDQSFMTNLNTSLNGAVVQFAKEISNNIMFLRIYKSGVTQNIAINYDGTLATLPFPYTILPNTSLFLSDGGFLIKGQTTFNSQSIPYLAKINSDGSINSTFTNNIGTISNPFFNARILYNKIYIYGDFTSFAGQNISGIIRYNLDGTPDASFNSNLGSGFNFISFMGDSVNEVNVDNDGNLYLTLSSSYITTITFNGTAIPKSLVYRIDSSGKFDYAFSQNLANQIQTNYGDKIWFLPDNQILISGVASYNSNTHNLVKVYPTGSVDIDFLTKISLNNFTVQGIESNDSGNLVIYGNGQASHKSIYQSDQGYLQLNAL